MAGSEVAQNEGKFLKSLKRNAKQIREDRANVIFGDTNRLYRRKVEDLEDELKKLQYSRDALIDLAPDSSMSNVVAPKDFDAATFIEEDLKLGVQMRNIEIKLEIAKRQYTELFGGE